MSYVKESHLPGKDNYGYIFDQTVLVNATNYEKLFLKAMLEELSGRKQVAFFSKVFEKLIAMCNKEQIKCPSPNKAAQLCMALARTHVINLEQGPSALEWKISFNTPRDDVHFAVQGLKARVFLGPCLFISPWIKQVSAASMRDCRLPSSTVTVPEYMKSSRRFIS